LRERLFFALYRVVWAAFFWEWRLVGPLVQLLVCGFCGIRLRLEYPTMNDQEQPIDPPFEEETDEQKRRRELMEDIALSQEIDYLRNLWEKEK
jgi:hypothetical protein